MSTLAQDKLERQAAQKRKETGADSRNLAEKAWDTVNVGDSGRSWFTSTPTMNKSVKDSVGDIASSFYAGTEKTLDAVEALTGITGYRQANRDKKYSQQISDINSKLEKDPNNKELQKKKDQITKTYQREIQSSLDDTKWAGTEDKGVGDRLKKSAGTAVQALTEWVPVGKGAQAGNAARKAVISGGQKVAEKGAKEVTEKGVASMSKMAKAKLAAKIGGQQSLVGGVGAVGGTVSEDGATASDVMKQGIIGMLTGGALGAASTYLPDLMPKSRSKQEPTLSQISDASKKRPDAEIQKAIEQAHNAGDIAKVEQLIPQLSPDMQKPIRSALGLTDNAPPNAIGSSPAQTSGSGPVSPTSRVAQALTGADNTTSSSAWDMLDQSYIQKAIQEAHQAGDDVTVTELIGKLSPEAQSNMRASLKISGVSPPTAKSLTDTVPARQKDIVMNADAEGGGSTMVAPIKLRVLGELEDEADARSGLKSGASQLTETKTQKGAQYIVDDIDKLQQETGIDVESVDRQVAAALSGNVRASKYEAFKDAMGRNFQDTLTYATRTMGKTGANFVMGMLQGNKFKRDALNALRDDMVQLRKLNKGKSLTERRDIGTRIGAALDDRKNYAQYLKNDAEKELFDHYVRVFDYVKALREKSGLEVLENYRPWVNMVKASEPPMWLSENITDKHIETLSRFSKKRIRTTPSDDVDNNLADMIYGYVNSQLNEMAYDAPVKRLKANIDTMNAGNKANSEFMNNGIDYMRTLVQQAVSPQRKNQGEKIASTLTTNIYKAILPFNVRLSLQNKTQKLAANSRVSREAVSLSKQLDEVDAKELEGGLIFGDSTVYGQLEDVNPDITGKGKGLVDKIKTIDPYQRSESDNVISSYHKGAMQAVVESDIYKNAKKQGMKTKEATHIALQDPAVREAAIRRGNVVVNDTQFGASPLARPQMLREEGSLWGVLPKKTIYMFTRFPIGMSQHTLEILNNKNTRALEVLKNGDPRAVPIAEMRSSYKVLLDSMKDARAAVKNGTDIGIPEEVLNQQIKVIDSNLRIIDKEIKNLSQIRGGKSIKNLGKMWAAAAAIQIIFDGGIQSFADDPVGTTTDAVAKTNPTMGGRIVGKYSPLASIRSAASPLDIYGNVNTRAIANYIPGVGLAVNRGRDIRKIVESLTGKEEQQ